MIRRDDILLAQAVIEQGLQHVAGGAVHLAVVSHARSDDRLVRQGGAYCVGSGGQQTAIASRIFFGQPDDVRLVPDLPVIDLRIALGQGGHACGEHVEIRRGILIAALCIGWRAAGERC